MKARAILPVLLLGAMLFTAACDSDDPAVGDATTEVGTASESGTDAAAAPASADTGEVCTPNESPNGNDYTVTDLPADDPDGGLVVHADAGVDSAEIGVLPSGTAVVTTSDPADCLALADGSVWWHVYPVGDGVDGYVNSRLLVRSPEQEIAGRAELCAAYARVLAYRDGPVDGENFAPGAETAALRNLLDGPPPGIVDALERISSPADGADLALAYDSLTGYVGPLCP